MSARIILVPHPGSERLPSGGSSRVPWPPSDSDHRRKFLRTYGEWALSTGESGKSWLEFWGEYEGPTFCTPLPQGRGLPQGVHSIDSSPEPPTRNTDPWIFHPGFVWSLCRHDKVPANLPTGSVILFGSTVKGEWLLDTVMVVERRMVGVPGCIGGAYDRLVLPTIDREFWPFTGVAYSGNSEFFSFVPAARVDTQHRPFRRPPMNSLFPLLSTKGNQQPSPKNAQGLAICTARGGVQSFWTALVKQIEQAGLVLGTAFDHPSRIDQLPTSAVTATGRGVADYARRLPTGACGQARGPSVAPLANSTYSPRLRKRC